MSLASLDPVLSGEVAALAAEGRAKAAERIIAGYVPPTGEWGPRYLLEGTPGEFMRMNSNSYLSLSHHPSLVDAADRATHAFGVGPGAVRFIDGTATPHRALERRIARFVERPAARIFNSAYTTMLGLAAALTTPETYWVGDELNHNCIIRAMRFASVPRERRAIFRHNDAADLDVRLAAIPAEVDRVLVVFDGIFSMRGDRAPLADLVRIAEAHAPRFTEGVVTVMDDSHGLGAYGATGRGTEEYCGARADVLVGTFGKAFGVNGGFVAASEAVVEAVRQKADTYIYTNPLSAADCAAALAALDLADGEEGRTRLAALGARTSQFRQGLERLGLESIPGPHPVVPLLLRDTGRVREVVSGLFERRILVVGLTFPVVPRGDETIRFQINAAHTRADIELALDALATLASTAR